jgi:hypothetical protein
MGLVVEPVEIVNSLGTSSSSAIQASGPKEEGFSKSRR